MNESIKTLSLAQLHEQQGYYRDALDMYVDLGGAGGEQAAREGIRRVEARIAERDDDRSPEAGIADLFEQWLLLMVLRQRLKNFIKIRQRLS